MTIAQAPYTEGYKRTHPRVVHARIIELSSVERKATRKGRRGCSCYGHLLTDLARYCVNVAIDHKAKSWSIFPIPGTSAVQVNFHNWPEMGCCSFDQPVQRRKNYWWDERPVPNWMAPSDERAIPDDGMGFDPEA